MLLLTGGRLVAVMSVPEVLRILYDWDAGHPYDNRIRTSIQGAGGDDAVVDMMKGTGGVFLTTDHCHWS